MDRSMDKIHNPLWAGPKALDQVVMRGVNFKSRQGRVISKSP
jgi:hypothetical protein